MIAPWINIVNSSILAIPSPLQPLSNISTIYSLADYKINDVKVRNDATYNKDYLSGRYGAIPVLENFVKF